MGFINDVTHVGDAVVVHHVFSAKRHGVVRVTKRIKDKEYLRDVIDDFSNQHFTFFTSLTFQTKVF